jgi:hypothetical protein
VSNNLIILQVYGASSSSFIEINFLVVFAQFYELFNGVLQTRVDHSPNADLLLVLNRSRRGCIALAHSVLLRCYVEKHPMIDDSAHVSLSVFETLCQFRRFLADFQRKHSLLELLSQVCLLCIQMRHRASRHSFEFETF